VTSELILEGEYDASELDEITQLMTKHLEICDRSASPLPLFITDDEFVSKLKNWNEKTTTSPSSLHLGHWKALLARHDQSHEPTSDACKELDAMQSDIRRARLTLINYALWWGFSYDRWKNIVNVMILKDPGVFKIHRLRVIHIYEADYNLILGIKKIHRLRVIHIYEADYNLILGIKWRALIHSAADKKQLNNGQYGRPERSPMEPVFIEEMENEISRASRKSLVKFDNDATSC
jgi:hypothetical protein